jgi:hypothetical protein
MATKMRPLGWKDRDRNSQLAQALYPHLSDPETRKQMLDRAGADGEQKRADLDSRIVEGQREYGVKPDVVPGAYDRVPGLRRAETAPTSSKPWWSK